MVRFFSNSHPVSILLLFLLGAVIRIPFFMHPVLPSGQAEWGELFHLLHDHVFFYLDANPVLYPLIAYGVIFIQGLSLNGFINHQKLFATPHLLFVLSYIVFTALMPEWNTLSPQLLVSIILLLLLQKMMLVYQKPAAANELFILSCLAGVGSMLYKPAIVMLLMVFAGLLIFRPFRLAEWIIVLFGLLLPYYLGFSYLYIFDFWGRADRWLPLFIFQKTACLGRPEEILTLLLLLLPGLIGFLYVRLQVRRMLVLPRKGWAFVSVVLLLTITFVFSGEACMKEGLFLTLIPVTYYITAFLYYPTVKFYPSLYIWLVLGFLMVSHFL